MYIHAYQSYLWNSAASHRLATYGAEAAVVGDLVLPRGSKAAGGEAGDGAAAGDATAQNAPEQEEGDRADGEARREPHVVTAEEAAAGAFSIEDVVLPMPGKWTRYPEHATAQASSKGVVACVDVRWPCGRSVFKHASA